MDGVDGDLTGSQNLKIAVHRYRGKFIVRGAPQDERILQHIAVGPIVDIGGQVVSLTLNSIDIVHEVSVFIQNLNIVVLFLGYLHIDEGRSSESVGVGIADRQLCSTGHRGMEPSTGNRNYLRMIRFPLGIGNHHLPFIKVLGFDLQG